MFSNGVIGFLDPTQEPYQGEYGFCCEGYDNTADRPASMFTLFPLQTDLINYGDGKFMTRGDDESMTYGWYDISEYGRPNSSNTFEAEIYNDGMYQFRYGEIDVQRGTTIGSTGDPSLGQYEQHLYGLPPNTIETITSYALNGMCESDPLYDPNCPGYAEAYAEQQFEQNCMADPLYDPSCPGYEDAYYNEQCSIDPLYDSGCSGYEDALLEEECSNDPLYDTSCDGYDTAYFEYQCEQNALYDESCSGYNAAYFDYQCSQNALYDSGCPGYDTAYFNQQCSANALYDTDCPGYEEAYFDQQCSNDPLYDSACPGYETAYFNQQCLLDSLYDSQCPGYEEAYAAQQLERTCSANPQSDPRCDDYVEPSVTDNNSNDDTQITTPSSNPADDFTEPAITGDSTIDSILRDGTNETQQQQEQTVAAVPVPTIEPAPIEEREREEEERTEGGEENSNNDDDESDEERSDRRKKMKDIAEREARSLADDMSKAASIEQQQATQARVMSLISFVPDFGSYARKGIPQPTNYYASTSIYDDATIPDSNFGARNGLAQEILHERMVDMQYDNNKEGN